MMDEHFSKEDEERRLIQQASEGSTLAFEELVKRHEAALFRIAFHLVGDVGEAADIVQEVFLSVYRNVKTFEGRSKFSTWLSAITVNRAKNALRKMKRTKWHLTLFTGVEEREENGERPLDPASPDPPADTQMEQEEIRKKVRASIEKLAPDFRAVLVLKEIQDLSYEEIAETLSLAGGTVKSRLSRARDSVKECLKRTGGVIS